MKKNFALLLVLVFLGSISCQEKIDIEKEKEAIIAVIQGEKDGFSNMDFDQWSKNVLQDSSYIWMASNSDEYWLSKGYSEQVEWIKESWSNWDSDSTRERIEFEIMELKITPKASWAVIEVPGRIETLFLEKVEETWLISGQTVLVISSYHEEEEMEIEEPEEKGPETEETE